MFKFYSLIDNDIFNKYCEVRVIRCTSSHVTHQNVNFTKTPFSQDKMLFSLMIHLEQCLLNISAPLGEGQLTDIMPKCQTDMAQLGQDRDRISPLLLTLFLNIRCSRGPFI